MTLYATVTGDLTVYTGPMFARKTRALLDAFRDAQRADLSPAMLRPASDVRTETVQTHDGDRLHGVRAIRVDAGDPHRPRLPRACRVVCLDEVQFLPQEVAVWVERWRLEGRHVFAAGLDLDYLGDPFTVTADLMAAASCVQKLSAVCDGCKGRATRTARREPPEAEERVRVGGADLYAPRCLRCWRSAR